MTALARRQRARIRRPAGTIEGRYWPLTVALLALIAALLVLHIGVGTVRLTPREVLDALLDRAADPLHRQVVWDLRLPRGLIAIAAGAMLGLAGAILQTLTRNPLAEPGLTGVSAGAVLAAVLWLTTAPPGAAWLVPPVALAGGFLAALLVYLLSRDRQRRSDPLRLALVGVLIGSALGAASSLLLVRNQSALGTLLLWIIGSLNGRVWVHWWQLCPWALATLPLGLLSAGLANALGLGDEVAAGLGMRIERARVLLILLAAALTAGAVATVGAIGFIGLIGPHVARRLVGEDARRAFPLSALLAAALLLAADLAAQTLTIDPPFRASAYRAGLPVGAVTAFLGGPFFLYLIGRSSR